jgi:hypothetical protein
VSRSSFFVTRADDSTQIGSLTTAPFSEREDIEIIAWFTPTPLPFSSHNSSLPPGLRVSSSRPPLTAYALVDDRAMVPSLSLAYPALARPRSGVASPFFLQFASAPRRFPSPSSLCLAPLHSFQRC